MTKKFKQLVIARLRLLRRWREARIVHVRTALRDGVAGIAAQDYTRRMINRRWLK